MIMREETRMIMRMRDWDTPQSKGRGEAQVTLPRSPRVRRHPVACIARSWMTCGAWGSPHSLQLPAHVLYDQ